MRDLWTLMNGWVYQGFEKTYREIGVDFDKYYYESENYLLGKEIVEEGLQKNICFKKADGSVWIDLTDDGLDQKVLIRADGTSVYITQDLGTIATRYKDFPFQQLIYTVANEQDYHFKVLKLICKKLGKPYADGIYHLSYGMVDLPSGRMKSREGTVVDADDIIEEMKQTAERYSKDSGKLEQFSNEELQNLYRVLGLGALKFFILKVDPKKRMVFNPEESIDFHGTTGPFIQYTHARIKSVLRKAEERKLAFQHGNHSIIAAGRKGLDKRIKSISSNYCGSCFRIEPCSSCQLFIPGGKNIQSVLYGVFNFECGKGRRKKFPVAAFKNNCRRYQKRNEAAWNRSAGKNVIQMKNKKFDHAVPLPAIIYGSF